MHCSRRTLSIYKMGESECGHFDVCTTGHSPHLPCIHIIITGDWPPHDGLNVLVAVKDAVHRENESIILL